MDLNENVCANAAKATENLLPAKSRWLYEKEYNLFTEWRTKNAINSIDETVLLAYFQELVCYFSRLQILVFMIFFIFSPKSLLQTHYGPSIPL